MIIVQTIKAFFQGRKSELVAKALTQNNWTDEEIDIFVNQLKQTIAWTNHLSKDFDFEKGFYGTVFRKTNPVINGSLLFKFEGDYTTWNLDDYDPKCYQDVLAMAIGLRPLPEDIDLSKLDQHGRILSFQTCVTTHDGAPIAASKCFVDESDVPPIDTWFFLKNNYFHSGNPCKQVLFCWIPKAFESVMQVAINVEILDSYRWLDENDNFLYNRIKKAAKH